MCEAAEFTAFIDLTQREKVILWAMRAWVIGITEKIPVEDQIAEAFSRIGAPDAAGQLYAFMWILSQSANRTLKVDCVCNKAVSADECLLLESMALIQARRGFEALILLRSIVRRETALAAADAAGQIVTALSAGGLCCRSEARKRHGTSWRRRAFCHGSQRFIDKISVRMLLRTIRRSAISAFT